MIPSGDRWAQTAALVLVSAVALAGCGRQEIDTERFLAFGTLVEISIYGAPAELSREAMAAARENFDYMHETWHAWHPSALGRVNSLIPTGQTFTTSPALIDMIVRSQELADQSEELFNPAIGRLMSLWGFQSDEAISGPPPSPAEIAALVAEHPSMSDLVVERVRVRSRNPAVQLDFGGFAKGYGVDRVVERLKEMGIENAIVNAGGDLRAFGRPGDRRWRIGIRHPREPGVLASIEIHGDESVFTSGDYERYFDSGNQRYHHIIDPRTGYPADGAVSVTVVHDDAATADAAATALFVAGSSEWARIATRMGIEEVMLVDREGAVHMTPAMSERIRFEVDPPPRIVVRDTK